MATTDRLQVLIINLTPHLGDTIMQMPVIQAIRAANPDALIEYAAEKNVASLLRLMPELDHVYALDIGCEIPTNLLQALRRAIRVTCAYWKNMRGCSAQICLLPRWGDDLFRARVLAYLVGSPMRVGFAWDVAVGASPATYRDALLTKTIQSGNGMHEVERYYLIAHAAGLIQESAINGLTKQPISALGSIASSVDWPMLSGRLGLDDSRLFAIVAPGASMPRRRWPDEHWARVIDQLSTRGLDVVILAGPSDASVAERVHEKSGKIAILVAAKTNLVESVALMSHAKLFLGSDSGPGHIAGGLGIPTVILFVSAEGCDPNGGASPERVLPVGPFVEYCRPPHSIAPCVDSCTADDAHCIALIELTDVLRAALRAQERYEVGAKYGSDGCGAPLGGPNTARQGGVK